jgi:hypothetical protein
MPEGGIVIGKEEIQGVPATAIPRPPLQLRVAPAEAPRTSGKAVASLVFGIAGIPIVGLLLGWFAILFGIMARREMAREPSLRGAGLAAAGVVLGALDIVVWILLAIAFWPSLITPSWWAPANPTPPVHRIQAHLL